jgi:hypothetical protein
MRQLTEPAPGPVGIRAAGPRVRVAVQPDLAPGENARGAASGAAWSYLLPDRELGTILSLGQPTAPTRVTLEQIGRELIVAPNGQMPAPLPAGSVGLVAVLDPWWTDRVALDSKLGSDLERVVASDGSVFARLGPPDQAKARAKARAKAGARARAKADARARAKGAAASTDGAELGSAAASADGAELALDGEGQGRLWLGVSAGEVRAIAPAGDRALIDFALARLDQDESSDVGLRRMARRTIRRWRSPGLVHELGVLHGPIEAGGVERPPRYVRVAAAAAGLSIDDRRWVLIDPGSYSTKKLLMFLFRPGATEPDIVVKLVRDARFNARLEGAWWALSALHVGPPAVRDLGPAPAFFGTHAGLALMGETIVEGGSLKGRLSGRADDPLIAAVVDRLVALAAASADSSAASPAEIGADLREMYERFTELYRPTPPERKILGAAVDRIAGLDQPFPLVLQHGDPGTWNVVVGTDGQPMLIDWEAAVPHGMPLWDLLYFMRSTAVGVARRRGTHDPLVAFEEAYLVGDTPLSRLLADATERVCTGIGLERDLVEPLFFLCWMHRALKESSTLRPGRMGRGHYRRLLALAVERRPAPGLQRVFGAR